LTETRKDGDDPTIPDSESPDITTTKGNNVPWKANVTEMPEKYTVKPFETRKTGGNHPDTGKEKEL